MDHKINIDSPSKNLFQDSWVWKMAWRDGRNNYKRLLLFISSVIIGIAALVAINSFRSNLQMDIDSQAKDLLGADLVAEANKPFEQELLEATPFELLHPLIGHLCHGGQLDPFQQRLIVRNRHDGALVIGQKPSKPGLGGRRG